MMEDYFANIFGTEAGGNFVDMCKREKILDLNEFCQLSDGDLKEVGFKMGDILKLRQSKSPKKHHDQTSSKTDARIQELLSKIRKNRTTSSTRSVCFKTKSSINPRTKQKSTKIQLGWLHSIDGGLTYTQKKRLDEGGGTRDVTIVPAETTFSDLTQKMINIFIPNDHELFDIKVGNFKRECITDFEDLEGNSCTLSEYMHSHGLFASKFRLYLMTYLKDTSTFNEKDDSSTLPTENASADVLHLAAHYSVHGSSTTSYNEKSYLIGNYPELAVDGKECKRLDISYVKKLNSLYDPEITMKQISFGREQCFQLSATHESFEDYNEFKDGYKLRTVSIEDKIYLEQIPVKATDDNNEELLTFIWPQVQEEQIFDTSSIILHHPSEIFGLHGKELMVGVLVSSEPDKTTFTWIRDGITLEKCISLPFIVVRLPGTYSVTVHHNNTIESSKSISFVKKLPDTYSDTLPVIKDTDFTYNERDIIGHGSYGTVYKGEWMGTSVAIKRFSLKRQAKAILTAVKKEYNILCRLRHPNIVQVLGIHSNPREILLFAELVEGHNLETIIFGQALHLNTENKIYVGKQILQAISYLHNITPAVIHRDIKCANILVASDSLITKICDLGLSNVKASQTVMCTTKVFGTLSYMAPELLTKNCLPNEETDVWSMACTLLELFTEKEVWEVDDDEELMLHMKQKMEKNLLPSAFRHMETNMSNDGKLRSWIQMLNQCFCYIPVERPSAKEFLIAIKSN